MKPQVIERDIKSSGIAAVQKTQIAEGQGHIVYNVLRKKMYSDAPKSIFREYCANAFDEHVRLNKADVPFQVTFPNQLEPTLVFRDYGRGLTQEQVFHFFGQFGASDKRDSNQLIGAFGLGCKVAHAYTDSFTIVSYLNGVKRVFNYYIGQDNIGDLARLGGDVPTTEPNGLEIRIAIEPKDIPQFISKGAEVIKYFPVRPIVKGLQSPPNFADGTLVTQGTGWRYYRGGTNKAVCMMGPIAYDINVYSLTDLDTVQRTLLSSNLQIDIAIGDVDVTSSRESLEYTDRTVAAIKAKLQLVHDEMVAEATKDFAAAKTEFEVRKLYYDKIQNGDGYGNILRHSMQGVTWNGIKITSNVIDFRYDVTKESKHYITRYDVFYTRRSKQDFLVTKEGRLSCTSEMESNLYFDDTDKNPLNYKRRMTTLVEAHGSNIRRAYILQTDDVADFEKTTGLKVADLKSFNAITPTITRVARGGSGIDIAKRKKHQTKVFELDLAELKNHHSAASDNWKTKNIDLPSATGVYMRIDRFKPSGCMVGNIYRLRDLLAKLELVGVKLDVPIYGIKTTVTDTGNLKHFDVWIKEVVAAVPGIVENVALGMEYNYYTFHFEVDKSKLKGKALEYQTLSEKVNELHHSGNTESMKSLLKKVGIDVTVENKLEKLCEELFKELPLLQFIQKNTHDEEEVLAYINQTGKYKPKP